MIQYTTDHVMIYLCTVALSPCILNITSQKKTNCQNIKRSYFCIYNE